MRSFIFLLLMAFTCVLVAQGDSGIAYVRIKKGIITFKKNTPPEDVRVYITTKLQNEKDGHYRVNYKNGNNTMYDLTTRKVDGPGETVFKLIGGLIVLTLTILQIASAFSR